MHQSSYRALPWVLWKWSSTPLSALRLTRCLTGCSTAGISPEIHQRFASPCPPLSPSPVTAAPSLCTTENVGWDQNRHFPVSGKLLVPQWTTQGILWVAPCAAAALVGGESPHPWAQWCSSLTASMLRTEVFLPAIVRLRQALMLPLLPVLFWSLSRNSRSSLPFGVKAWTSADSDYLYQLHVACLACLFFFTS